MAWQVEYTDEFQEWWDTSGMKRLSPLQIDCIKVTWKYWHVKRKEANNYGSFV